VPTYVYACRQCDARQEIVQKMSDPPLTECGKCQGVLRRVLFPPAVVYKGSGFYTTDYKNGGRKESSPAAGGSDSGSDSKADTKTDRAEKPEAATAPKPEAKSDPKP
jgi:putative FmdB family regulatory protein